MRNDGEIEGREGRKEGRKDREEGTDEKDEMRRDGKGRDSVHLLFYLSLHVSISICVCLSVCASLRSLCVCVCLSLCLSVCLSLHVSFSYVKQLSLKYSFFWQIKADKPELGFQDTARELGAMWKKHGKTQRQTDAHT